MPSTQAMLGKLIVPQYPTGFEIFQPLLAKGPFTISIATYGLASPEEMEPVLSGISSSVRRRLPVGYSKNSHDRTGLLVRLSGYKSLGWDVRLLPNSHLKIWLVGRRACHAHRGSAPDRRVARGDRRTDGADAILVRLIHRAHKIALKGPSRRKPTVGRD